MARRKIVLVLVEGPSDDAALGVLLNRLYSENNVHIEILHGDITSDICIPPEDIVKSLGNIVKNYAESMHFKQNDFQEVIHLIDMDGVYIPDRAVIFNPLAEKPIYSLTDIQTAKPDQLIRRNLHKRKKLSRLSKLRKVYVSIPYHAYYMSSNLDHVLYNKLNSSEDEKEENAYAFARRYKDDIDGFLTFISDSVFSIMGDYQKSWEFIRQDYHSLERFTNFGLCFKDIREKRCESEIVNH